MFRTIKQSALRQLRWPQTLRVQPHHQSRLHPVRPAEQRHAARIQCARVRLQFVARHRQDSSNFIDQQSEPQVAFIVVEYQNASRSTASLQPKQHAKAHRRQHISPVRHHSGNVVDGKRHMLRRNPSEHLADLAGVDPEQSLPSAKRAHRHHVARCNIRLLYASHATSCMTIVACSVKSRCTIVTRFFTIANCPSHSPSSAASRVPPDTSSTRRTTMPTRLAAGTPGRSEISSPPYCSTALPPAYSIWPAGTRAILSTALSGRATRSWPPCCPNPPFHFS